jgi:hypothetical protein
MNGYSVRLRGRDIVVEDAAGVVRKDPDGTVWIEGIAERGDAVRLAAWAGAQGLDVLVLSPEIIITGGTFEVGTMEIGPDTLVLTAVSS